MSLRLVVGINSYYSVFSGVFNACRIEHCGLNLQVLINANSVFHLGQQ